MLYNGCWIEILRKQFWTKGFYYIEFSEKEKNAWDSSKISFCDVTAIQAGNHSKKYLPVGWGIFMFIIGSGRCVKELPFKIPCNHEILC